MPKGVLRIPDRKQPKPKAQRGNNEWCAYCQRLIPKDIFALHKQKKHHEISNKSVGSSTVNSAALEHNPKQRKKRKNIPSWSRFGRFEGGVLIVQGGMPTLGKRR